VVSFTDWGSGEPNNASGEYFAMMYGTNRQWNDYSGSAQFHAILETDHTIELSTEETVPVLEVNGNPLFLRGVGDIAVAPRIVRQVYWTKVFQVTLGPGASYSEEHSYTHGTSETNGMSFGWSIGISTEIGWGPVSTQIETEFHQDFNHEVTISEESTFTKTYECTAPQDRTVLFALWQLRERYVICDDEGEPWTDAKYELDGDLPYLDQGLEQEYLQTLYF
jgi:hypothetical protein